MLNYNLVSPVIDVKLSKENQFFLQGIVLQRTWSLLLDGSLVTLTTDVQFSSGTLFLFFVEILQFRLVSRASVAAMPGSLTGHCF